MFYVIADAYGKVALQHRDCAWTSRWAWSLTLEELSETAEEHLKDEHPERVTDL